MEEKDKIYDFFRRHEHKLEQKPSVNAWDRLEAKLERHEQVQQQPNIAWHRYGGMVAAVFILVGAVTFLTIYSDSGQMKNAPIASADEHMVLAPLKDLPNEGSKNDFFKIVQYQKEYQNNFQRKISEGQVGWELKPRDIFKVNAVTRSIAGSLEKKKRGKEIQGNKNELDKGIANNNTKSETNTFYHNKPEGEEKTYEWNTDGTTEGFVSIPKEDDMISMNMTTVAQPELNIKDEIVEQRSVSVKSDVKSNTDDVADYKPAKPIITEEAAMVAPAPSIAATSTTTATSGGVNVPSAPAPGNSGSGVYVTTNQEKESIAPTSAEEIEEFIAYDVNDEEVATADGLLDNKDKKEEDPLSDFNWLLGDWTENTGNGTSIESWKKVDANTIKGQGELVANGVTLFSENMEIRNTSKGIIMLIPLDNKNKKTKYKLVSQNDRMIMFENKKVDFPNQLILYKNSKDDFTTIMQNSTEADNEPDASIYLQNRNILVNQKISRNLQRVK